MKRYQGKKLLILGTSVASVDIVKYARSQGAYVYVIDYLSPEKSEAKRYADEHALISTVDIEAIYAYAKEKEINGIFCGVSEINLQTVRIIAERLGLPCYFSEQQWNILQDKKAFKKYCRKHSLCVPMEILLDEHDSCNVEDTISFPVIVKPVDCGAGIGIQICNNHDELKKYYSIAQDKSQTHRAIIEEYVIGDEFSAAYTIVDGEYYLSTMGDKYLNRSQEGYLPLPCAYVYPSKHLKEYIDRVNKNVIAMLKSLGLTNGTAFVQGIYRNGEFVLFEGGLRMGGTALYRFVYDINKINIMEMLVNYALTGSMHIYSPTLENPNMNGKHCCLISLLNGGGIVGKIDGYEKSCDDPSVVDSELRYRVGDTVAKSGTLKQSHIRFFVIEDSLRELSNKIQLLTANISVQDIDGKNMLLEPFDANRLFE